jgi:hypothetical protein
MRILVACEESQAITKELRKLGHDAFSCDLLPCSGGHPEWHFQEDVFKIIENHGGFLEDGNENFSTDQWEMMIAHPPCTFLAVSGARWFYHPEDKDMPFKNRRPHPRFPNRANDRDDALEFFKKLCKAPIEKIAVENPIGIVNTKHEKPTQIVHPWMFGDEASKATCLWLKNLPPLTPTNIVGKGERVILKSGKSLPKWYSEALTKAKTPAERRTLRSKTFEGMAKAMAFQWTNTVNDHINK